MRPIEIRHRNFENSDKGRDRFLKSTCDIGDPPSRAPYVKDCGYILLTTRGLDIARVFGDIEWIIKAYMQMDVDHVCHLGARKGILKKGEKNEN